ncbi:MAG: ATP-binding domain-containing protein [Ignavibacteria bacterium]|nr:ATP-binding domain-containing protein [Ignavibacteria bacterium]
MRLFNIKHIKGLEFEAVIFVDIDDSEYIENGLLDRFLYVGISRASFFLQLLFEMIYLLA